MALNKTTIARPYAKAAFVSALQTKTCDGWSLLLQIAAQVMQEQHVMVFMHNPRVTPEQRFNFLCEICGDYLFTEGNNFFKLLATKQRLDLLPEIAALFEQFRVEHEKTAHVEVTSALPLTAVEQQKLAQALQIRLQRAVTLACQVDGALLGGAIIKTGDWVIDDSVRSKLTRLNSALVN